MKLIIDDEEVKVGQELTFPDGSKCRVRSFLPPTHTGSTGKVCVDEPFGTRIYNVAIFHGKYIE